MCKTIFSVFMALDVICNSWQRQLDWLQTAV